MNKNGSRKPAADVSSVPARIMSPELTDEERVLIHHYCVRFNHTKSHGRGLLLAALREIRRELEVGV